MDLRKVIFECHNNMALTSLAEMLAVKYTDDTYEGDGKSTKSIHVTEHNRYWYGYPEKREGYRTIDLGIFLPFVDKETVELDGKKYLKSDLEEAVKKLKPIEE